MEQRLQKMNKKPIHIKIVQIFMLFRFYLVSLYFLELSLLLVLRVVLSGDCVPH